MTVLALLAAVACAQQQPAVGEPVGTPARVLAVDAPTPLWESGGLVVDAQRWTWGSEHGMAWRARVPLPGCVAVVASEVVQDFEAFLPQDVGPWAAINGGFYDEGPMGLVVSGGVERHAFRRGGGSGVFSWQPSGPVVVHRDDWQPGAPEALQSIDRLVDDGRNLVKDKPSAPMAARSAVVVGADALWLVAAASDDSVRSGRASAGTTEVQLRRTAGNGLSLHAFAEYLVTAIGARQALNLDGAISTQVAAAAPGDPDVSDAGPVVPRRLEVRGERGTINALVLRPACLGAGSGG